MSNDEVRFDLVLIGAGIAGAGLAHALLERAPKLKLALLEAESSPGYHTTGRSAAFFAEAYGGPLIQPLSTASRSFLENPPADFADVPLLTPRGGLHLAPPDNSAALDLLEAEFVQGGIVHERVGADFIRERLPRLRPEWAQAAIWEPGCRDIDVAAFHQGYLKSARRKGAVLVCDSRVTSIERSAGEWRLSTSAGQFAAPRIVNVAGAWADEVAALAGVAPIGIVPMRRTIVVADVRPPAENDMPLAMDAGGSLYFRPDAGRLWISPHDETPDVAHDVQPDELDIAITIDRFEKMMDWPVARLSSTWAGLRSFAPDRLPVIGPSAAEPDFFWCAGQGGWGIQTSPAASQLAAALLLDEEPPFSLNPELYRASRFG